MLEIEFKNTFGIQDHLYSYAYHVDRVKDKKIAELMKEANLEEMGFLSCNRRTELGRDAPNGVRWLMVFRETEGKTYEHPVTFDRIGYSGNTRRKQVKMAIKHFRALGK